MLDNGRLRSIAFLFPQGDAASASFFGYLSALLGDVPGGAMQSGAVIFRPSDPPDALPTTALRLAHISAPLLSLETTTPINLDVAGFTITSTATGGSGLSAQSKERTSRTVGVALGPYVRVDSGDEDFAALLPIEELTRRLRGHLIRLDHTGVILPAATPQTSWDMLIKSLAAVANLYRYPTGEPWPFILPATEAEFATEITRFTAGRAPRFELVHDAYVRYPLIQFDLETDLTHAEIKARFPEPYGRTIPGLSQFFRSVYLFHPWPHCTVRVDLRYRNDGPPSDWDTGTWLVTAGGRVR